MDNKVQEITEKIYKEGVEKGQAEAQKIIEAAEAEKAALITKAQQEAEKIVANAKKSAEELNKNTQSELQLYSKRAVEALKSEITNLITGSIVKATVAENINNEWLQKMLLTLASNMASSENVVIQTADAEKLTQFFAKHAKDLLNKGIKIEQVNGIKAGFAILPADGSYKLQFGEEEFIAFFKEFLRPQLVEMLF